MKWPLYSEYHRPLSHQASPTQSAGAQLPLQSGISPGGQLFTGTPTQRQEPFTVSEWVPGLPSSQGWPMASEASSASSQSSPLSTPPGGGHPACAVAGSPKPSPSASAYQRKSSSTCPSQSLSMPSQVSAAAGDTEALWSSQSPATATLPGRGAQEGSPVLGSPKPSPSASVYHRMVSSTSPSQSLSMPSPQTSAIATVAMVTGVPGMKSKAMKSPCWSRGMK